MLPAGSRGVKARFAKKIPKEPLEVPCSARVGEGLSRELIAQDVGDERMAARAQVADLVRRKVVEREPRRLVTAPQIEHPDARELRPSLLERRGHPALAGHGRA